MPDEPDYITLLATVDGQRSIVAIMRYNRHDDSFNIGRCSEALSIRAAKALAESWAAALHLEVR